jgi:hypothetical protein
MFRQCFLKYMQGYLAACIIFLMASLGLMNISEGDCNGSFFRPHIFFQSFLSQSFSFTLSGILVITVQSLEPHCQLTFSYVASFSVLRSLAFLSQLRS